MQDKWLISKAGRTSGTFFPPYKYSAPSNGSSLTLNLLRFLSYSIFVDLVSGNNAPNPFTFIQGSCYYFLTTSPVIAPNANFRAWDAYQSIVDELVNGTAGTITQYGNEYIPAQSILTTTVCNTDLVLQSNCSNPAVATFLSNFADMVKNNTFVKDCLVWHTGDKAAVALSLTILALALIYCIFMSARAGIRNCRRRGYSEINEVNQINGDQVLTVLSTGMKSPQS